MLKFPIPLADCVEGNDVVETEPVYLKLPISTEVNPLKPIDDVPVPIVAAVPVPVELCNAAT